MKKFIAFLTLFIAMFGIASEKEMTQSEIDALAHQVFEEVGLTQVLKGEEYKKVYNDYTNEDNRLWRKSEYQKLAEHREKFCYKGLYEACQRLGEQYMFGVGVKADTDVALLLMYYSARNSQYEYLKIRAQAMITLTKVTNKLNQSPDEAMQNMAKNLYSSAADCIDGKDKKDTCMIFFIFSDVIPNHLTSREIEGEKVLAVDMASKIMLNDFEKYKSASVFAPFISYIAEMSSYTTDDKDLKPQQTPAPVAPQSNSQNLAKKHKFTDGFSVDISSGIVADTIYGLAWQDGAKIFKGSYKDALNYCENLNYGGYSDWRLPSVSELLSISDQGRYKPAINKAFKYVGKEGGGKYGSYWSSTKTTFDANSVWVVQFNDGFDKFSKAGSEDNFARCVRNLR